LINFSFGLATGIEMSVRCGSLLNLISANTSWFKPARLPVNKYLSKEQVADMIERELGLKFNGRVFLLTHWSYFGYHFNPVSYYYCYNTDETLLAVISEVSSSCLTSSLHY
jgi:DUF1365 family protein